MGLKRLWSGLGIDGLRVRLSPTRRDQVEIWSLNTNSVLTTSADAWRALIADVRDGRFDRPGTEEDVGEEDRAA
jgi:hypothetical protein